MPQSRLMRLGRADLAATAVGCLLGALLFASLGAHSGQASLGGVAGALLGGLVGLGARAGWVHRVTAGAASVAVLACALAAAVHDYSGITALLGALLGAFLGWLGWRFLLAVPAVIAGQLATLTLCLLVPGLPSGPVQLGGMVAGAAAGFALGTAMERNYRGAKPASADPTPE